MSKKKQAGLVELDGSEQDNLDALLAALEQLPGRFERLPLKVAELPTSFPGKRVLPAEVELVKRTGILFPIVVSRRADRLTVRDGETRVLWAHAAGLEHIDAIVYDEDDAAASAVVTLILNSMRANNPVSELKAIAALERAGYSDRQIARLLPRLSLPRIRQYKTLASLQPDLLKALRKGRLTVNTALAAAKRPRPEQDLMLATLAEKEADQPLSLADVQAARQVTAVAAPQQLLSVPNGSSPTWRDVTRRRIRDILVALPAQGEAVRLHLEAALSCLDQEETG